MTKLNEAAPIPSITELQRRSDTALRARWREPSGDPVRTEAQRAESARAVAAAAAEAAEAAGVRNDAPSADAVPKIGTLYEKHRRESLTRWRNGGDKQEPVGK